jgi:hypothetical protein
MGVVGRMRRVRRMEVGGAAAADRVRGRGGGEVAVGVGRRAGVRGGRRAVAGVEGGGGGGGGEGTTRAGPVMGGMGRGGVAVGMQVRVSGRAGARRDGRHHGRG